MLPFEFTVLGPPVSHQSRNKAKLAAWREVVTRAASERWGATAQLGVALRVKVSYYHQGLAVRIDNDNLVKPILDALIGLVYRDDQLITDTMIRKTSIDGLFRVRGCSSVLLEALSKGQEFVHIVIEEAAGHENPLR
jgi:Holliday junction resolvase RusA-like endonuclease